MIESSSLYNDEEELPPPFYEDIRCYEMGRHGRGKHYEACVYCGRKPTKLKGGRPTCRMCRNMINAGVLPRE